MSFAIPVYKFDRRIDSESCFTRRPVGNPIYPLTHTHTHTHTYTQRDTSTHTHTHTHTQTHARTRARAHTQTHTHARTRARTQTHSHARTHILRKPSPLISNHWSLSVACSGSVAQNILHATLLHNSLCGSQAPTSTSSLLRTTV